MSTPDEKDHASTEREGDEDDSVVTPPTYPAYSTPPPQGLPDAEHD